MKIAVPVNNRILNSDFGQSSAFELFEIDAAARTRIGRSTIHVFGGCGSIPAALKANGVDTVICGGLDQGALQDLPRAGIVVGGAPAREPSAIVHAFLTNTLHTEGAQCAGHGHHHGHGHGHCRCGTLDNRSAQPRPAAQGA